MRLNWSPPLLVIQQKSDVHSQQHILATITPAITVCKPVLATTTPSSTAEVLCCAQTTAYTDHDYSYHCTVITAPCIGPLHSINQLLDYLLVKVGLSLLSELNNDQTCCHTFHH